jgi:hypothetical protein
MRIFTGDKLPDVADRSGGKKHVWIMINSRSLSGWTGFLSIRWRWRESNPRPKDFTARTSTSVGNCSFYQQDYNCPKSLLISRWNPKVPLDRNSGVIRLHSCFVTFRLLQQELGGDERDCIEAIVCSYPGLGSKGKSSIVSAVGT